MNTTAHHRLTLRVRALLGERRNDDARSALRNGAIPRATGPVAQRIPPGPYVTINVGGPLNGIVTLTTTRSHRVVVEAAWGGPSNRDRVSLTRPGEGEALILADSWANQLIDGHEPTRDLLRLPRNP